MVRWRELDVSKTSSEQELLAKVAQEEQASRRKRPVQVAVGVGTDEGRRLPEVEVTPEQQSARRREGASQTRDPREDAEEESQRR